MAEETVEAGRNGEDGTCTAPGGNVPKLAKASGSGRQRDVDGGEIFENPVEGARQQLSRAAREASPTAEDVGTWRTM
jgi:hypothetical protein